MNWKYNLFSIWSNENNNQVTGSERKLNCFEIKLGFSKKGTTFTEVLGSKNVKSKLSSPAPFGLWQREQFGDGPGWSREKTGPWIFKGIRFIRIVLSRFWPLVSCIPYVIVIFTIHILIKTDLWMFVFWVFSTMSLMPCTWFALVTAPPFLMENIQFNPTMSNHVLAHGWKYSIHYIHCVLSCFYFSEQKIPFRFWTFSQNEDLLNPGILNGQTWRVVVIVRVRVVNLRWRCQ